MALNWFKKLKLFSFIDAQKLYDIVILKGDKFIIIVIKESQYIILKLKFQI